VRGDFDWNKRKVEFSGPWHNFRYYVTFYFRFWEFGAGAFELEGNKFFDRFSHLLFEDIAQYFLFTNKKLLELGGDFGNNDRFQCTASRLYVTARLALDFRAFGALDLILICCSPSVSVGA
jgi:hypothetical protein